MVVGIAAGNATMVIIGRALVVQVICWFIGQAVGKVAQRTVDDQIEEYKQANPLPLESVDPAATEEGADQSDRGEDGQPRAAA